MNIFMRAAAISGTITGAGIAVLCFYLYVMYAP
jgi:hypothetical protein